MDLNEHEGEHDSPGVLDVNNESPVMNGIGMWFYLFIDAFYTVVITTY